MKHLSITSLRLQERAFLVRAEISSNLQHISTEDSLDELERLAESAGAQVVARFTQSLKKMNPSTLIGRGKVEEIRAEIQSYKPDIVIFDGELSPAQQRNLDSALLVRVIDRSQLILDIFAQRARSKEGKLQVELAQLEYLLPRLTRRWTHLSRLAGGIGTRGPGETQLEVDRRRVRERIGILKRRLNAVSRNRALQRQERLEVPFPAIALIGYTNSGKSTLMNALTRAGVHAEEKLFATLDPTTRSLRLPNGDQVMVTDTVGFINNIPHSLIEAFKSTLEEVKSADLLLHVADMTSKFLNQQILIVNTVLKEIGVAKIHHLLVANKIDMVPASNLKGLESNGALSICRVSALTGQGISGLLNTIGNLLDQGKEQVEITLSPNQGSFIPLLYRRGRVLKEKVDGDRIHLTALVSPKLAGQVKKWIRENKF